MPIEEKLLTLPEPYEFRTVPLEQGLKDIAAWVDRGLPFDAPDRPETTWSFPYITFSSISGRGEFDNVIFQLGQKTPKDDRDYDLYQGDYYHVPWILFNAYCDALEERYGEYEVTQSDKENCIIEWQLPNGIGLSLWTVYFTVAASLEAPTT